VKDFSRMKQMILDFLTEFESEDDFGRQVDYSAALYFLLAEAFRGEKDYEEEQFYLKKSLYWAKRGKTVYEYLYLRLAVYELQQENYEQALAYCDSGLGSTKFISNRFHAESQAILLFAKSKIYEKMGRPEAAREYLEKSRKLHPSPNLRNGFNPWWIKM